MIEEHINMRPVHEIITEIREGVNGLPHGKTKEMLMGLLVELDTSLTDVVTRILQISTSVADAE